MITNLFSVPMDLPILNISYKWNDMCPSGSGLFYFIQHKAFEVHPHCSMCQCFISFYDWVICHSMGISLAVQWLRLCNSITGGVGSISGQRTKIPHAVQRGQKKKKFHSVDGPHFVYSFIH